MEYFIFNSWHVVYFWTCMKNFRWINVMFWWFINLLWNAEQQIRCVKWISIDTNSFISWANPMFDLLLESSRWDAPYLEPCESKVYLLFGYPWLALTCCPWSLCAFTNCYCAYHILVQPNFRRYNCYFLPDQAQILLDHFNVLDELWGEISTGFDNR